jgi:SNF2 family DNA or RNA helicase
MFYSPEHNAVIYKTDNPLPIMAAAPDARRINGEYVAVPATLSNLQNLRRLALSVVPPLEVERYDYPIKGAWFPLPHQKVTANFLALNPRCFCFSDMGTMKTLSALWAADFLIEQAADRREVFRWLIVAPLSILKAVWGDAIFNHFLGRRKYVVLRGGEEKRRKLLEKDVDFYIINLDGLRIGFPAQRGKALTGLAADLAKRDDIKGTIIDEASGFRDHTSIRSRAARTLVGARPYLWLLTGTPTPNGPLDAYGLARLVGTTDNESFTAYKNRVMMQVGAWKWAPRIGAMEAASKMLSPSIRFDSALLNLPPQTPEQREVAFSPEQAKAYKTLKQEAVLSVKSGAVVHAVNEAALRMKLIQVSCGCVYDTDHVSHDLDPTHRVSEVEAIIGETTRKVVIFAPLTNVLIMLSKKLKKWETAIVNGQTKLADRERIFRRFGDNKSDLRVLLADPGSVAHGVNDLVSADVVIWFGGTDKGELYAQGNKRVDRPGQTHPSKVIQLVSSQVERDIYARLARNESMQGLILKLAEEP